MDNKKPLPLIGKTYKCYDDGKVRLSRQYEVDIIDIIPWKDADETLKNSCKELSEIYPSLFIGETDYFIVSISHETKVPTIEIFIRTEWGGWFGMGELNGSGQLVYEYYDLGWCSGLLDSDNKLTEELENKYG